MSDTSQGTGWWRASDGKWYPPELFPSDWQPSTDGSVVSDAASVPEPASAYAPTIPQPVSAPSWSSIGGDTAVIPSTPPVGDPLAHVGFEPSPMPSPSVGRRGRLLAAIALLGGALAIVGSFLPWASATGAASGRVNLFNDPFVTNYVGTLICGAVIVATAAVLVVDARSKAVRAILLMAALAGLGLTVFSVVDLDRSEITDDITSQVIEGAGLDLSLGIWLTLAGTAVAVLAGAVAAALVRPESG